MQIERVSHCVLAVALVAASGPMARGEAVEEPADEGRHHVHGDHELHRNHIGAFVGITAGGDDDEGGKQDSTGTIAVEYERRLTRLFSVGAIAEFAGAARRDHVGLFSLAFRPWRHPKFVVGAWWERSKGTELFAGRAEPLLRLGFGWAFEVVPRNTVTPEINVDFVDGEVLYVAGATIGWSF